MIVPLGFRVPSFGLTRSLDAPCSCTEEDDDDEELVAVPGIELGCVVVRMSAHEIFWSGIATYSKVLCRCRPTALHLVR